MVNCPVCNNAKTIKILNWDKFGIFTCKNCSLLFTHKLPSNNELNNFYQGFLFDLPDTGKQSNLIKEKKEEILSFFPSIKNYSEMSFLDYGGGTGATFAAAKSLGFDSYYFDLDKQAEEYVKVNYKLINEKIHTKENNRKYDIVYCDNVIEHVTNPLDLIIELKSVLKSNGTLIIKTPNGRNIESLFYLFTVIRYYFFKALRYNSIRKVIVAFFIRFWHCDPPRHLFSFSKKSLNILFLNAGFSDSKLLTYTKKLNFFKGSFFNVIFDKKRKLLPRLLLSPLLLLEIILKLFQIIYYLVNPSSLGNLIAIAKN